MSSSLYVLLAKFHRVVEKLTHSHQTRPRTSNHYRVVVPVEGELEA